MVGETVRLARPQAAVDFEILADGSTQQDNGHHAPNSVASIDSEHAVLEELPVHHQTPSVRQARTPKEAKGLGSPEATPDAKLPILIPRRRPALSTQTFEPLKPSQEEESGSIEWDDQTDSTTAPIASSGAGVSRPLLVPQ